MSGEERQTPWEHGSTIAKAIKSVEIEGLTGPIRYWDLCNGRMMGRTSSAAISARRV